MLTRVFRVDGFLADPLAASVRLRDTGYSGRIVASSSLTVHSGDIHIRVSKASCSLRIVQDLSEGLREIQEAGLCSEILERYRQ